MKKTILMLGAASLIGVTACKKNEIFGTETSKKESSVASEEKTSPGSGVTVDGVEVPKFSNQEVQQFATEYAHIVSEMSAASRSGDVAKSQELTAKAQEWTTKNASWSSNMTPDDSKLWTDFLTKLSAAEREK
ncbi:hypothetical protein [Chryseobacterium wangxinyae]|uniref:hypothetical protein n=1 Tax=Chryseobacterium sp. CY353 TaxID=2997334 RepID=UPI00226DDB55|nr:hypothetical protein [Chryseobacterium sp. CY353]MCY0967630.1 hypothetical protein [Chryseobacterium sp. CY353]